MVLGGYILCKPTGEIETVLACLFVPYEQV